MLGLQFFALIGLISASASALALPGPPAWQQTILSSTANIPVPGNASAFYVGDTSNDILEIHSLDLYLSAKDWLFASSVTLRGEIKAEIGSLPIMRLTFSDIQADDEEEKGVFGFDMAMLNVPDAQDFPLKIKQDGVGYLEPPRKGMVEISSSRHFDIPPEQMSSLVIDEEDFAKKAIITAELLDTDGNRMTSFRRTVWIPRACDPSNADGDFTSCLPL